MESWEKTWCEKEPGMEDWKKEQLCWNGAGEKFNKQ